jgi:uncharacterized membrane protein
MVSSVGCDAGNLQRRASIRKVKGASTVGQPDVAGSQGTPLTVRRAILIRRPRDEVFHYVTDFNRAHEWRPEVSASRMSPPGEMAQGSRLEETAVVLGRQVITESVVTSFEPGRHFGFTYVRGPIPVNGTLDFEAVPDGTRLVYTWYVQLVGAWRLAAPYLRRSGPKMLSRGLEGLRARLES